MKKQNGITLVTLTITIVVMMIIAAITAYNGTGLVKEAKLQDLRTNMLLIQAKAKEYVEEVNFQIANLDANNAEDLAKIETIKNENLKGTPLQGSEAESAANATGQIGEGIYYYLDNTILKEMGIQDIDKEEGYFIVKYDIDNIKVEVINTKGYQGNYTLTQLNELSGE